MTSVPKFKIAICGAGIGGLALAVSLMQHPDIDVEVFEGANRITEVGAGIAIFPRVWRILQALGLGAELLKHVDEKPIDDEGKVAAVLHRKSDEPIGRDLFTVRTTGHNYFIHRADFQSALLRHLGDRYPLHTSKRLRSYVQSPSGITLAFQDGSSATCDILVGADGIHSAVRRKLLEDTADSYTKQGKADDAQEILKAVEPAWSGTTAYRAVFPTQKLAADYPDHRALTVAMHYIGKGAHVVSYPIQRGKLINLAAFKSCHELENTHLGSRPLAMTCKTSDILPLFENWEPEVQNLIACADSVTDWAIHTVRPLRSYSLGRVCLIGDAAHAMTPFQASGAGQAIEDAFVVAKVLGHPRVTLVNAHSALAAFDEIRRPFSQDIQDRARQNGQQVSLYSEDDLDNLESKLNSGLEWAWTTTIDSMVDEAVALLEEKLKVAAEEDQ